MATDGARRLAACLAAAGKPMEIIADRGGATIAVLPFGGRLLGAFAPGGGDNFLWTNPRLEERASALRLLDSAAWANSGGERTWIAPEAEFFRPDYPGHLEYVQPRQLDPGSYAAIRRGDSVILESHMSLRSYRTREDIGLRLWKEFEILPLEPPAGTMPGSLTGVAYRATIELELLSPDPTALVGIWSLMQLPPDGMMIAATRGLARPVAYFGDVGERELHVSPSMFRWDTRGEGDRKIGVAPGELRGRLAYRYERGDSCCLVVRDMELDPSGTYIDAPHGAAGPACAAQFCAVSHPELGSFCELEYHSPAIGGGTGFHRIKSTSEVRCYRGSSEAIRGLAYAEQVGFG